MNKPALSVLIVIAIVLIIISQAFYIVDQREQAILLQFGQPVGSQSDPASFFKQPGLHFKIPVVQTVQYFDRRILSVDPQSEQVVISSPAATVRPSVLKKPAVSVDGETPGEEPAIIANVRAEPIIVDTFARYKITDPIQFLKTLRNVTSANSRIESILRDATKAELGKVTLQQLLSPTRSQIMRSIQKRVNDNVTKDQLGIEIVDVRIVRADLTDELRTSTVRRMISELKERATETRAEGEERALEIRSTADKEKEILLANAQRDAQILKGEGDNEAIKIYADAFNQDKEFYAFMRSMEAYRNTLSDPQTQLILSPNSTFFRYFQNRQGE